MAPPTIITITTTHAINKSNDDNKDDDDDFEDSWANFKTVIDSYALQMLFDAQLLFVVYHSVSQKSMDFITYDEVGSTRQCVSLGS